MSGTPDTPVARAPRRRRPSALAAVVAPLLAALAMLVHADGALGYERLEPPDGRAYAGVAVKSVPELHAFLADTRQSSVALTNRFGGRGLTSVGWQLAQLEAEGESAGVLSWFNFADDYAPSLTGGTSRSVARGDIDAYIVATAAEIRGYAKPLFVRMNWEMSGDWFGYSAYGRDGKLRPGNEHAHFRDAWRRTVEIFRGGTREEVDARLAALGLPGLRVADAALAPVTNVAWAWVTTSQTKHPDRQSPYDYYPGDAYVDWVGVDWYGTRTAGVDGDFLAKSRAPYGPNEIYARLSGPGSPGKPFMIGEWGVRSSDRHEYVRSLLDWMAARPKVKAALYFNVRHKADDDSRIARFPRSLDAFRRGMAAPRWIRSGAEVTDYEEPAGDHAGPGLSLPSPADGARLEGGVPLRPEASDPSGVREVRFYVDGELGGSATGPPWAWDMDTGGLPDGTHSLRIEADDELGNTSALARTFLIGPPPLPAAAPAPPPAPPAPAAPPASAPAPAPAGAAPPSAPAPAPALRTRKLTTRRTTKRLRVRGLRNRARLTRTRLVAPRLGGVKVRRVDFRVNGRLRKRARKPTGYRLRPGSFRRGKHLLTIKVIGADRRVRRARVVFVVPARVARPSPARARR